MLIYDKDGIKVYKGDCLEILPTLDIKVDCVLTDPPYYKIVKEAWDRDFASFEDFNNWLESVMLKCKDLMKDNGSLYMFGDEKNIAYMQVRLDQHFTLLNSLVWEKSVAVSFKSINILRSYAPHTERLLFYALQDRTGLQTIYSMPDCFKSIKDYMRTEKDKIKVEKGFITEAQFKVYVDELTDTRSVVSRHYFADSQYTFPTKEIYKKLQSTGYFQRPYEILREEYEILREEYEILRRIWNTDKQAKEVLKFKLNEGNVHPTQKPLELITYLLERSTKKDSLILDPFAGSGTTGIACRNLGRKCILIEKDEQYCNIIIDRLNNVPKNAIGKNNKDLGGFF